MFFDFHKTLQVKIVDCIVAYTSRGGHIEYVYQCEIEDI